MASSIGLFAAGGFVPQLECLERFVMKTVEEIQAVLDEKVNTLLGQHGGRAEITGVDREVKDMNLHIHLAFVKMVGGCRGCAGAKYTLNMLVTKVIKEFDPSIDSVVDITDHTDKTNAYYKE